MMKELIGRLDLNKEQQEEVMNLKKEMKKEARSKFFKFVIGRSNKEDMKNMFISKLENFESILTNEQEIKLKEMLVEMHEEKFAGKMMHMKFKIKEVIEELDLSEEQKDKLEALIENNDSGGFLAHFQMKKEIESILSEEQKEKAKELIIEKTHIGKMMREIEVTDAQKEKLKELHENMFEEAEKKCKQFFDVEIKVSEFVKDKIEAFEQMKSVLNEDQIKKLKKMHHSHGCHH